jgi:hypothetical protein
MQSYSPISLISSVCLVIWFYYSFHLSAFQASVLRLGVVLGISVHGISVRASSTRWTLLPDSISTTSTNISVCIIASLGWGAVLGMRAYDVLLRRTTRLHGSLMTNIRYRHVLSSSTCTVNCEARYDLGRI